jgi:hypothetical protein
VSLDAPELELDVSLEELGGVLELGELELGLEGDALPDIEPDPDAEDEPDGEDGVVADDEDEPVEDRSRAALGPLALRSQPYRPLTATAIGRTTRAALFSKLICKLL